MQLVKVRSGGADLTHNTTIFERMFRVRTSYRVCVGGGDLLEGLRQNSAEAFVSGARKLSLMYSCVAVCRFCAVLCVNIVCFSLLFYDYSTYIL
jgi:hypothetical protein